MGRILGFSLGIAATLFTLGAQAQVDSVNETSNPYFTISQVRVEEVPDLGGALDIYRVGECQSGLSNPLQNGSSPQSLEQAGVYLDVMMNIGKKIFAVILEGKPVVNFQTDMATALPMGISCWSDLTNWNVPQSKSYRIVYENGFGMNVVDFTFRVLATTGGSYLGKGKYINQATFLPAQLNVAWGFTFNAKAEIPAVFNRGTKENPMAGMQMNLKWSVDTPVAHNETTESFYVGGDNTITRLK